MSKQPDDLETGQPGPDPSFDGLLDYLKRARGFDFSAYKRSSLTRRVLKRMEDVRVDGFTNYTDYLEVHPDEFALLFNTILINVTSFFRDQESWDQLAQAEIPRILAAKEPRDAVRVWSAGCASGEEAYSVAILLAEAMGMPDFQSRVKIYATDMNEGALAKGRQGLYTESEVAEVPPPILAKYFEQAGGAYTFHQEMRRSVVFGRHDLISDAPISRVDLLLCRNTLMYFNSETQERILRRFNYALNPGGLLFLGKAEMLLTSGAEFEPKDLKRRFFVKTPRADGGDGASQPFWPRRDAAGDGKDPLADGDLRDAAMRQGGPAQVVVDPLGRLMIANETARALFALKDQDMGRPLAELTLSYRPVELRSCLERAYAQGSAVLVANVEWMDRTGAVRLLDVSILPLADVEGTVLGASVSFVDITEARKLKDALQQCNQERETAHEELQTTNEELQSTVEELETTNEELQSTNEELETMNEELQSTNEELRTSVEELRLRGDELDEANDFWNGVLNGFGSGLVVLDRDLRVRVWNPGAEDLWGLRGAEVKGKQFFALDFGLPLDDLNGAVRECLEGQRGRRIVLEATNRRGRRFRCGVTCAPLGGSGALPKGVTLMMEDAGLQDG
jgi:two-component system CheB/CheR fusion protein